MANIEILDYDGAYPNYCDGTLTLSIDDVVYELHNCLMSGGGVQWTDPDEDESWEGDWSFTAPEGFEQFADEIEELVNEKIPKGCCGGCI